MTIRGEKFEWKVWIGQEEEIKVEIVDTDDPYDDGLGIGAPAGSDEIHLSMEEARPRRKYAETVCQDDFSLEEAVELWNAIGLAILESGGRLDVDDAIREAVVKGG